MAGRPVDYFCSRRSIDSRERMFGTASLAEVWLLLEYRGPWPRDLLADSGLPADVKDALADALRSAPRSRVLFIKNGLPPGPRLSFFLAITREKQQALYAVELDDYRDLLSIDLAALADGAASETLDVVDGPLYLVCVNGRHDRCCAKFGLPLYRSMAHRAGQAVWQSSHVGGDRFAGNVVCLPSGVYYGHVTAEDVDRILADTAAGVVYLDKLRGRSCYGFDVQAADYFARVASGVMEIDAFSLKDVTRLDDSLIRVRLAEAAADRVHVLELVREHADFRNYLTCHAGRESDVPQYVLRSYRVE